MVDKPAGQLSVPGRGPLAEGSVTGWVQARWPEARIVHRLDMATSGLLLFARGLDWQRRYSAMFAERRVDKHYVALVHGLLGEAAGDEGEIDLPLSVDWPNRPRQQVDHTTGRPSLTHWAVAAQDPAGHTTRLLLRPHTGRTHQLRVHLQAIGHPILGDALYGPTPPAAPRLMLHAERLAFMHPSRGEWTALRSTAPF